MFKLKKIIILYTLMALCTTLLWPGISLAQSGGVTPATKQVEVGDNFSVSISFSNVNDLYALNFDLRFDDSILKFNHATRGTALLVGCSSGLLATSTRDNGDIYIYADRGDCAGIHVTAMTAAVNLHFTAVSVGQTELIFTNENNADFPKLTDKTGNTINLNWEAGVTSVAADLTPPVITLLGDNPANITVNSVYTDAGATAWDNRDGDITHRIITVNQVNTGTAGTYTVIYNVTDNAGNAATEARREVNVVNLPAHVSLTPAAQTVIVGETFELDLAISNIDRFGNIMTDIIYDSNILAFQNVSFPEFENICPSGFAFEDDMAPGLNITAECWEGISGNEVKVATIAFRALTNTNGTELAFANTELWDTDFNPVPFETNPALVMVNSPYATADLNRDGVVNSVDAGILMSYWGSTARPLADINQDGVVNSVDAGIMMSQWSK
jgi:hypothetical protein